MRISCRQNDPGYRDDAQQWSVYLNGLPLKDCVTADEEAGLAFCMPASDVVHRLVECRGQIDLIPPPWPWLRKELGYGTA